MNNTFLGIDTSNYTTSAALVENGSVSRNIKMLLDVPEGNRGVRQADALFMHTKNLPLIMEKIGKQNPLAVGVSVRPRDVDGSYMPCFLAGCMAARTLSEINGIPCYEFSHQEGHVMAALYSCGMTELADSRFIAFHVSGGTTELLFVDKMKIKTIGGTLDLNAGQLIDRTGVRLGLKFPCGKELEKLTSWDEVLDSDGISHVEGLNCNISGIENKTSAMIDSGVTASAVAAYTIRSILVTIDKLTENALGQYGELPVVFAGGVMSNRIISKYMTDKFNAYFASPELSCDNAAGVALLAKRRYDGRA